ncbi:MAG TPA: NADH-quinone oxidoreductase subunit C [Bryobacteraceae bacterium]|nr:NADH-quinone oxidoreductase subunit C [Bryobacteraceae bacterium]
MLPDALKGFPVAAALAERFGEAVTDGKHDRGELTLWIDPERIVEVCSYLKAKRRFNRLVAVTALDWYPIEPRFEVVYLLHSLPSNERLRLKCRLHGDAAAIDSVCEVWRAANWYEREVFDLFGVTFRNHPDLRRIMMPEDWEGHPLRKDYPKTGFKYTYQGEGLQ